MSTCQKILFRLSVTILALIVSPAVIAADSPSPSGPGDVSFAKDSIVIDGPAEGLIGNGRSVVVAHPGGFYYQRGGGGSGGNILITTQNGKELQLDTLSWKSTAFPGGIIFASAGIEIFNTALPDDPYGILIRFSGRMRDATAAVRGGHFQTAQADGVFGFSETGKIAHANFDTLRAEVLKPYTERGMVLRSPDAALDQAVLFNQYLLDLSYNGDLIVCELFRYADIWSRDLGSGFVPGAIFTNRIEAAKKCIDVDLARHEKATAAALKTTKDASQGGSAEGVGHLITALWDYYLVTGDRTYLSRVAAGLRPWVDAWLARDYARTGLIVDTTDWMDHSRYQMLPYGARTLYANAQMVRMLDTFSKIEQALGNAADEKSYAAQRDRFISAINKNLWDEKLGAYGNLLLAGQIDERTDSAGNSLALLGGVADPKRAARVLGTLQQKNWRPNGTLTITPRMTFNPDNDQNEKIWPWWVAYEALARFKNGNPDGGVRLLDTCAATIRSPKLPGMMDEIMDRDGHSEGGRAFATAAGSLLTSIYKGLFGIEILAGGMREVKITPNLPADWRDASLHQPTPGGSLDIEVINRIPHIAVRDARIKVIYTTANAVVTGAEKKVWQEPTRLIAAVEKPLDPPPFRHRTAALFNEPGFPHGTAPAPASLPRVSAKDLANLDPKKTGAVIIRGNSLPFSSQSNLATYLDHGGMLVFVGATMLSSEGGERQQLGGDGGVVEWYAESDQQWRPVHPRTGQPETNPKRDGTTYWEPGKYFGGWDAERGAFGFKTDGKGVHPTTGSPLVKINADASVLAAFTDFPVSSPWYFQALATTHTAYNFLYPARGEDLPCVVRLVNRETHGEIILIAKGAEIDLQDLLR